MDRRQFMAGGCACALPAAAAAAVLPVPASGKIGFEVLRNGDRIGEHHLSFSGSGGDIDVAIEVGLLVKMMGIGVFSYAAHAVESWRGGAFQSLRSQVNDNGTQLQVRADRTKNGYSVESTRVPLYTAPPNMLPLTYWNKQMLNGTILNIQTGHTDVVTVTPGVWNSLPTAEGGNILARRYDITGKLHLSVWYDQSNAWSGLEFHVKGDEAYRKITA